MKNATILTSVEALFAVLDLRTASVTIFKSLEDDKQELLRSNSLYNLVADVDFMSKYSDYKVIGLSIVLGSVSILIEEA